MVTISWTRPSGDRVRSRAVHLRVRSSIDAAVAHIDARLKAYFEANSVTLMRDVTRDDILHLLDIKMARILKFNSQAAEDKLVALKEEMRKTQDNIDHIIDFAIAHFRRVKKQYGAGKQRLTEIRSFDNIEATKVAERLVEQFMVRIESTSTFNPDTAN